jgi:hypothetical protein
MFYTGVMGVRFEWCVEELENVYTGVLTKQEYFYSGPSVRTGDFISK